MLVDIYVKILQHLNIEKRLELIAKLSQGMIEETRPQPEAFFQLYGAFNSDESAEDLIQTVRSSRTFKREIESL